MFGLIDDFLLNGYGLRLCLILQAFDELGLGFIRRETSYLFESADMFFLVLFELCPFDIDEVDLAIEVFLDRIVVTDLLVQAAFFLADGLFFLTDAAFAFAYFPVPFVYFPVVCRF